MKSELRVYLPDHGVDHYPSGSKWSYVIVEGNLKVTTDESGTHGSTYTYYPARSWHKMYESEVVE